MKMKNESSSNEKDIRIESLAGAIANKLAVKPSPRGLMSTLNSPFFVTVLGGLILWAVSAGWQNMQADAIAKSELLEKLYSERRELVISFADNIPLILMTAQDIKNREFWIAEQKEMDTKKETYVDGKNFKETYILYKKEIKDLNSKRSTAAYTAQIQALFDGKTTVTLAKEFSKNYDKLLKLQGIKALPQLRMLIRELDEDYQELIMHMTEELINERKNSL